MPYKSKAQQRFFFAAESRGELPKGTAIEWAHHTPDMKKLPERVGEETKEKKGFAMRTIEHFAKQAADDHMVEKLANDTQITPDLVRHLAGMVKMSHSKFVKAAYADPHGYTIFLKLASGVIRPDVLTKGAMAGNSLIDGLLKHMKGAGNKIMDAGKAAVGKAGQPVGQNGKVTAATGKAPGYFEQSAVAPKGQPGSNMFDRAMGKGPLGSSQAGRNTQAAAGGAGLGLGGASLAGGSPKPQPGAPEQAGPHEASVNAQVGAAAAPAQTNGPAANPAQAGAAQPQGGGMNPKAKALLAAGGVGLGAMGVGAMMRRRQKGKQVTAADIAKDVMRHAIVKKAAAEYRKEAADQFVGYLDVVAGHMTLEKAACVRHLQAAVAEGKPLSHAIKVAYPLLNGEQRGLLAAQLVRAAVSHVKQAEAKPFFKGKVTGRQESSMKMKDGAVGKMKEMSGC